jgi:hypothetical protein
VTVWCFKWVHGEKEHLYVSLEVNICLKVCWWIFLVLESAGILIVPDGIATNWCTIQGRIQDFKLGWGGGALKKIAPSGGRCENFWGISCGKSRFYAKKSYFFSNFRRGASPPGSAPAILLNMMSLVRSLRSSSVDYS